MNFYINKKSSKFKWLNLMKYLSAALNAVSLLKKMFKKFRVGLGWGRTGGVEEEGERILRLHAQHEA